MTDKPKKLINYPWAIIKIIYNISKRVEIKENQS